MPVKLFAVLHLSNSLSTDKVQRPITIRIGWHFGYDNYFIAKALKWIEFSTAIIWIILILTFYMFYSQWQKLYFYSNLCNLPYMFELNIRKIQIYFMHFTEIAKRTFHSLFFFFTFCRNSDSALVWGFFCSTSIALDTRLVWHSLLQYFECCWGERNMSVWQHVALLYLKKKKFFFV